MGVSSLRDCGFATMMMAMAHAVLAATPQEVSGHFLDVPALLEKRASTSSSPLLANIQAPHLEAQPASTGYRVASAILINRQHEPGGFIVVVSKDDGSFTALVSTSEHKGLVVGKVGGTQRFLEEQAEKPNENDTVTDPELQSALHRVLKDNPPPADGNAEVIITVLAGFSDKAVNEVGDAEGFALAQIETLNLALRNTGLPHIRIVLAGISTTPVDYPIGAETLSKLNTIFPNYPNADLTTGFFAPPGTVIGGIAYLNGRESLVRIITTDTFAHEVGHNLGASGYHCNSGGRDDYNFGHTTGQYSSIMCRSAAKFLSFSNPDKQAPDGKPLGNARYADMARVWRTNAPNKSRGGGHDMTKPILIHSQAAPDQCLDVLDGNLTPNARVGLWKCDPNNPNQRWYKTFLNNRIQIRLAAKPSLCLYHDPAGGNNRDVVLDESGCEHIFWASEDKALSIFGNGENLYLFRTNDNRLRTLVGPPDPASPGFSWENRSAH